MKKHVILLIAVTLISFNIAGQKTYTSADVFTEKNMIWFGLDYTHFKFIGQPSIHGNFYKSPDFVVKHFLKDWNMLPLTEGEKYDLGETFDKEYVYYDIDSTVARNQRFRSDSLISFSNIYTIAPNAIPEIVSTYKGNTREGIGFAYIVESYNSIEELATYYCVVFDVATKKIFLQEKITSHPQGGSVKTYWAGSFHEALEKNKKAYKKWKKGAMIK